MLQYYANAERAVAATISVLIQDGAGAALPGLTTADVRVTTLQQDALSFVGKTLQAADFVDRGSGLYDIAFTADELNTEGVMVLRVTPDPLYPGTMRQSTLFVLVADKAQIAGGFVLDREAWVPVLLELAGLPAFGIVPANVTAARYKKPNTAITAFTIDATNFREVFDGVTPTGLYQVLLPYTVFDAIGALVLDLEGAFDDYSQLYPIVRAPDRRVFVEVLDFDNDDAPLAGIMVAFTSLTTMLVVDEVVTDALGHATCDLPDGEYRITLSNGTQIFHQNNTKILVWDPDDQFEPARAAQLLSGDLAPYALVDGDVLLIQVNDGAVQALVFSGTDFNPPAMIASAPADVIAELITMKAHSLQAEASGYQERQLLLTTELEASVAAIQVIGGSANLAFNFPTDRVQGADRTRKINSFRLNGSSFVPPYPPADADLVTFTYRVVDVAGNPVYGAEINVVNKYNPGVRSIDGVSSVLGRKVLQFFTDQNGIAQAQYPARGKPKLLKGAQVDVILKGTGIVRSITVPQTDFTMMDEVEAAEDVFTIQYPNLPRAPRS